MDEKSTDEKAESCLPSDGEQLCSGPSCCAPDVGSRRWKVLVSLVVLCAAGAAVAYSLVKKSSAPNDVSEPSAATLGTKGNADATIMANAAATAKTPEKVVPELCGLTQDTLANFNDMAAYDDVLFILVPGEDQTRSQAETRNLEDAVTMIRSKGKEVAVYTANRNADDNARSAGLHRSSCVIIMNKGGRPSAVSGAITVDKLVEAFVIASRPPPSCSADCDCR